MTKQTVGQASYDLLRKPPEEVNAIDLQREMQKSVTGQLQEIIESHKTYADSYFIVYLLRKERLIPNAIRQQFVVRKTRPKPDYDCSLFEYSNLTGNLRFHWTIPDEETCTYLLLNKEHLSDDEKDLFLYVKKFSDGTLV